MDAIQTILHSFLIFHINAIYAIGYFLKNNFFFLFVLAAVGYMVLEELRTNDDKYVHDERRMT